MQPPFVQPAISLVGEVLLTSYMLQVLKYFRAVQNYLCIDTTQTLPCAHRRHSPASEMGGGAVYNLTESTVNQVMALPGWLRHG